MTLPNSLETLLTKLPVKEALIVDDAYDKIPNAESLEGLVLTKAVDSTRRASVKVRKELEAVLLAEGFDDDDFQAGFASDDFVGLLWRLHQEKRLKGRAFEELFAPFLKEQENKRADLKNVIKVLKDDLGFTVRTQGSSFKAIAGEPQLILLDLFLSFKDKQKAVDNSVAVIERMLEGKAETNRPIIIVMSSKGDKLSSIGIELKERAGLMGSKFRTLAKAEASDVLPAQLRDMLLGLDDAEIYAKWLDSWRSALDASQRELLKKLRLLDLSDLGYLYKYRLESEGMPLGTYLRKLAEDHVLYQLEGSALLEERTKTMNALKFKEIPTAQFLPSEQIPVLKYTSCFVNNTVVTSGGLQFPSAKEELVLGDLLIPKPKAWKPGHALQLTEGMEILVVLSQACDILQCKTDSFLFLRGALQKRKWNDDVTDPDSGTDVFYIDQEKFRINWKKAQITAWSVAQANIRLSPKNGKYVRIARFREVEALRLQNLFASNLTRVGTFATPHQHWNFGVRLKVPLNSGEHATLLDIPQSAGPATIIEAKDAPKPRKVLIFAPDFREQLVTSCKQFDWSQVRNPLPAQFAALCGSEELLKLFTQEQSMKSISAGSLNISVTLEDKPHKTVPTLELTVSDSAKA
jgi:hypothetical protein